MKLKDVKVGMRVAHLDCDGNVVGCANVKHIDEHGTILLEGVGTFDAVYLRKVKPKKIVSFTTSVRESCQHPGLGWMSGHYAKLTPFIGKRVRVTVKEIK